MEGFPAKFENFEEELKTKIGEAVHYAFPAEQYDKEIERLRGLRKKKNEQGLTSPEEIEYKVLNDQIKSCQVTVKTLSEYRKVLELLEFPKNTIDQIMNHENAHANVAEQLESQIFRGYRIRFLKEQDGRLVIQPQAAVSTNPSFPEKQGIEEEIMVTEAPLYYGDELSISDQKVIENLRKRL